VQFICQKKRLQQTESNKDTQEENKAAIPSQCAYHVHGKVWTYKFKYDRK